MFEHHKKAIETITAKLKTNEDYLAIIIGGSVAHKFETEKSDIDIQIVVSEEDYQERLKCGQITYYETESATYEGGYIDGKFISVEFLKKVAEYGTEPARFAYKDAFASFSKIDGIDKLIEEASKYPIQNKERNISKFYPQFVAWRWFFEEGIRKDNKYLIDVGVTNFVLFAGRLILAYNETLYPYHKWFLRVLDSVTQKPDGLMDNINNFLDKKDFESMEKLYDCVNSFTKWIDDTTPWNEKFLRDSEVNWLYGDVPIGDL